MRLIVMFFICALCGCLSGSAWAWGFEQSQHGPVSRIELAVPNNISLIGAKALTPQELVLRFDTPLAASVLPSAVLPPLAQGRVEGETVVLKFLRPVRLLAATQLPQTLVRIDVDRGQDAVPAPERTATLPKFSAVVVVDAGHGGRDPGAVNAQGVQEKDLTLAIATKLAAKLVEKGVDVRLTRTGDDFIELDQRVAFAVQENAQVFVSIHADSFGDPSAFGVGLYTRSNVPSSPEAAALALRENGVVGLEQETTRFIDSGLSQTQRTASKALAKTVHSTLKDANIELLPDALREAGFLVLRQPFAAALLVETGFLTNETEAQALQGTERQEKIAEALANAVLTYTAQHKAE